MGIWDSQANSGLANALPVLTLLPKPERDILQERGKALIESQAYAHICHLRTCRVPGGVGWIHRVACKELSSFPANVMDPCSDTENSICIALKTRAIFMKPGLHRVPPPLSHLISPPGLSVPNSKFLSFPQKCLHVTSDVYTTTQMKFTASRTKGTVPLQRRARRNRMKAKYNLHLPLRNSLRAGLSQGLRPLMWDFQNPVDQISRWSRKRRLIVVSCDQAN